MKILKESWRLGFDVDNNILCRTSPQRSDIVHHLAWRARYRGINQIRKDVYCPFQWRRWPMKWLGCFGIKVWTGSLGNDFVATIVAATIVEAADGSARTEEDVMEEASSLLSAPHGDWWRLMGGVCVKKLPSVDGLRTSSGRIAVWRREERVMLLERMKTRRRNRWGKGRQMMVELAYWWVYSA